MGSRTQEEVSSVLLQIGWHHSYEYFEPTSGLSLDMAQVSTKVAVEFDGPVHYFANETWMLTGRSKLKRRLLDLIGWDVVFIDYRDWDVAPDKVRCIFDAFKKHGVEPNIQMAAAQAVVLKAIPLHPEQPDDAHYAELASKLDRAAPALLPTSDSCRPTDVQPSNSPDFFLDYAPSA